MTILDIVNAVAAPYTVWRTLHGIEPLCRDGRPIYISGNASVLFQVRHEGGLKMLKCYTRKHPYLKEIYGEQYYPRELHVISISGEHSWVDCLLYDRIEGNTLDEELSCATTSEDYARLAEEFDQMACRLLTSERRHGDLKPENIIVTKDGRMEPIDFDAAFIPSLAGRKSAEIGTAAYQHPARTSSIFDEHLDDYSIAFLSTLLHAAAIDPTLLKEYSTTHEPPFMPREIVSGKCPAMTEIIEQFARRGDAIRYRIARMLSSQWPRLFNLKATICHSTAEPFAAPITDAYLEQESGLWGCRNDQGWIVPPLFDDGFDPTEGYMVASLGGYTHLIRLSDRRVVHSFDKGIKAKPVHNAEIAIRNEDSSREYIKLEALLQNSSE